MPHAEGDPNIRHKVGDRVRMIYSNKNWAHAIGATGVVVGVSGYELMTVEWDANKHRHAFYHWRFEAYSPELKVKEKVATRDARPARYLGKSDDPERPIRAAVQIGGEERELTYQANGLFYKNVTQDIDLVNV